MTKAEYFEISKSAIIGLLLGVGLGLIFDQLLVGVIAGLVLGGGVGFALSRRVES